MTQFLCILDRDRSDKVIDDVSIFFAKNHQDATNEACKIFKLNPETARQKIVLYDIDDMMNEWVYFSK